ncbi:phage holin family protein [Marivita geojedonensis]|uniref:Phage holin family protein n=1 Tax=Marivita geojedonensis TaxID=1123756 RepID=A0A1X4NCS1_9RHOB|nr:phage holin family protein [Marivita geojedonensis]OSQ44576.1 hypothetical protein MGEO_19015 [Marivita geojedonensis]PRY73303.1 putative superfamily III holin-X [Marivita geojedonensis]
MTDPTPQHPDWRALVVGILAEARALLRTELQLAKRELSDNASRAGGGLILFGLAALVAFVGLTALAVAAVLGVAALGLSLGWAALTAAVGFLAVALILALIGRSRLSAATLTPRRTLKQFKSDVHAVKEMSRA